MKLGIRVDEEKPMDDLDQKLAAMTCYWCAQNIPMGTVDGLHLHNLNRCTSCAPALRKLIAEKCDAYLKASGINFNALQDLLSTARTETAAMLEKAVDLFTDEAVFTGLTARCAIKELIPADYAAALRERVADARLEERKRLYAICDVPSLVHYSNYISGAQWVKQESINRINAELRASAEKAKVTS